MQAVKEQLMNLDFKEEFIEKIFKEYSTKKIEEKLDLLMDKRNIQNPAGWLRAALKNDYRGEEEEAEQEGQPLRMDSRVRGNDRIPNVIANDRRECGNLNSQLATCNLLYISQLAT